MSRLRSFPAWAKAVIVALTVVTAASGCDEDGKALPATCADPLPLDDIGNAGFPDTANPCVTPIGDAVSFISNGGTTTTTSGSSSGGNAGKGNGGTQNNAGGADAGAGGS